MNIFVKNLSKKYKLSKVQTKGGKLSLQDSFIKLIRLKSYEERDFWALKGVNFSVKKGEALGIIGTNGSGKSTLLKIISNVTLPTKGEVRLQGKVASLLSYGVGFHPDLSGRDNIYLNGAIMGFKKDVIDQEFDNIVSFSGIGKFLDTPIKYYSSGMYVRLAFAIATAKLLEPDIFLVDEVLSVGDNSFQKKCLERMRDFINKSDKTILYVSHNMKSIQEMCTRCIWLKNGKVELIGNTNRVVKRYLEYTNKLSKKI